MQEALLSCYFQMQSKIKKQKGLLMEMDYLSSFCFEFSKKKGNFQAEVQQRRERVQACIHLAKVTDWFQQEKEKNISHTSTKTPPPSNISHLNMSPSGLRWNTHSNRRRTLFSAPIKHAGVEMNSWCPQNTQEGKKKTKKKIQTALGLVNPTTELICSALFPQLWRILTL